MITAPIKILLVEDNQADAVLLQDTLLGAGGAAFAFSRADRMQTALDQLTRDHFDAILLDMTLPDSSGLDTLERIQNSSKGTPTIIITGVEDEELAISAIRHGAQDYLVKGTVDGSSIIKAIRYAIDRRKTEEALRRSEAAYATAKASVDTVNAMFTGVVLADMEGRILSVNPAFEKVTGYGNADLSGKKAEDLVRMIISPEDVSQALDILNEALDGKPVDSISTIITAKNGSPKPLIAGLSHIRNAAGLPSAMILTINDISDLRRAEARLQKSQASLAEAQRIAHIGDWEWDIVTNELAWSAETYRIFELTPRSFEATYDAFINCVHADDRDAVKAAIKAALNDDRQYDIDHRIVIASGSMKIVHQRGEVFRDGSGRPVRMLGTVQDITRRKKAEEALESYQAELRSLSSRLTLAEERARRQLAIALHDTVGQTLALGKIKLGALGGMLTEPKPLKLLGEIREMFVEAVRQTRTLSFELSPPILYELGLGAAIEWLGEDCAGRHGFQVHFQGTDREHAIAETVSILFFQSARELLTNIAKHAKATRVDISIEIDNGRLAMRIADNGTGLAPNALADAVSKKNSLGLFSIRERMKHIGGTFEIQSTQGHGTVVQLSAPAQAPSGTEPELDT